MKSIGQQHGNTDRQQQKRSDRQPPMPYQVRLPDLDAHRLRETRNPYQTSVCLKTTEKIISLVEHAVEKDEDQGYIGNMEFMIEKVLKIQQNTSAYLNLRLDILYRELNGKFETLDAHVMMLDAQVSQTVEAVKKQEALVKEKDVESERHQVNAISDNDFGEVLEQEKLEEDAFLVESSMYIGISYWCRPTPTTEHGPTSSAEHRSTLLLGSDKTF
ncbi:hypothetical protein F2Q68_00031349 [Brassica cretica]|uniref:Uncharacterized protein n=1 Tax=Brassica cretica TaxID=69181 RepID=A0A8S9GBZ4_BRACR|nr:hypothetical protein F2Q68_00031349 [Brassica cretica]